MRIVTPLLAAAVLLPTLSCSARNPVAPDVPPAPSQPGPIAGAGEPVKGESSVSAGAVILTVPDESPGPPIYAGIARFFMNTDGQWVAIEIVRERRCIPAEFNLLQFVDIPRAFGCRALIGGKEWWTPADLVDPPWAHVPPVPFEARLVGLPGMLIDFVRLSELTAAVADGALTIGELEGLPSFLSGRVTSYQQVQHNSNHGQAPGHSETTARGSLDDGRSFFYQKADRDNEPLSVQISFR